MEGTVTIRMESRPRYGDLEAAAKALGRSPKTLSRYLRGEKKIFGKAIRERIRLVYEKKNVR